VDFQDDISELEMETEIRRQRSVPEVPMKLKVGRKRWDASLRFEKICQLGAFRTTAEGTYSDSQKDVELPRILPRNKLQGLVGTMLSHDFANSAPGSSTIADHVAYYEFKHKCFVRWLHDNYEQKVKSQVDFVAFHRIIADLLKSPVSMKGKWDIYGMNVDSIIYLWAEAIFPPQVSTQVQPWYFRGHCFEKLVCSESLFKLKVVEHDKVTY
jgi:hypothetical protein